LQDVRLDAAQVAKKFTAALAAMPAKPASFSLYFLEGSDELAPESRSELARISAEIAARPVPEIAVIGHTDLVGSEQFNDLLSMHRAQRVREELVRAGIEPERIELVARGKREPLFPTAEGVAEPRNRRVEINVR
jgi:outer membrane protein OmpA-like peptidoglycan-associated protein